MKKSAKIILSVIIGLTLIGLPLAVFAAGQFNQTATVTAEQIIDGNYINAASVINIAGPVNGDIIVAGSSITISGTVAGDIIAIGSTIKITGPVAGSIRVIGSNVEINNVVEKNAWAVASTVNFGEAAAVGWDIFGAAGTIEVKGKVDGNITVAAGTVLLAGEVGKDVDLTLGRKGGAVLAPTAKVAGNFTYRAAVDDQLVLENGAIITGATKREAVKMSHRFDFKKTWANIIFFNIISFFSLLVLGLVAVTLFPKLFFNIREEMMGRPWVNLARVCCFCWFDTVAVLLLAITLIGLPLALIVLTLYLIGLYLAKIFAAFAVGMLALNYYAGGHKYGGSLIWPLVLGLFIVLLVLAIPFIGFLAKILLTIWAFGAMIAVSKEIWRDLR